MCENAATVIGIELLAAAQGIEFHRPLTSSDALESAHGIIRKDVPAYDKDRFFAPDIQSVKDMVRRGEFVRFADDLLPSAA